MTMRNFIAPALTLAIGGAMFVAPTSSFANGWHHHSDRGEWNALAIGSAALGIYGIASHQPGLAFAGALGTGYSLYRASDHRDWDDGYRYVRYDRGWEHRDRDWDRRDRDRDRRDGDRRRF